MTAIQFLIRAFKGTSSTLITLAAAVTIGFGVPLAWLFVASKLYDSSGAVTGSVALFIGTGILVSYLLVLLAAAWIRARLGHGHAEAAQYRRSAWNRSLRDARYRTGQNAGSDPIERFVIVTAIIVMIGFVVWFAIFAGDPYSGRSP